MIVWLASYPRSGNSLFANLVKHHLGVSLYSVYQEASYLAEIYTYLDKDELRAAALSQDVYFVKTHELPEDDFPAVYLVRDGRDAIVSYAHYIIDNQINISTPPPENPFAWALDALINSPDQFGGWGAHVQAWTSRSVKTVLIRYDDLIQPLRHLEILKSTLITLGFSHLEVVQDFPLPDFSSFHQQTPNFYRKGQVGAWIAEMPSMYHLQFWEMYGDMMQKLGYKKDGEQSMVRTEFVLSEYALGLESKLEHMYVLTANLNTVYQENQRLTGELQQAQENLKQTTGERARLAEQNARELAELEERRVRELAEFDEQKMRAQVAMEDRVASELATIEEGKNRELVEKEKIIQSFRHSLSYSFLNGPFRHLPFIAWLHQGWERFQARLNDIRRYYFMPHLGVLYQYPPKACDIPARYFQVGRLLQPAPIISIITPTYNYAHFLERTMKSVLSQGYPELEYIVQDGGSTDGTVDLLEKFKHRLKHFESRKDNGQAHAINLGFRHATGEIMAYLNSDDVLLPGTLDYVANYFTNHPDIDVVYGHRLIIDENDGVIGDWIVPPHDDDAMRWADFIPQETMFWRKRIWEKVGAQVDESFHFAMDWDLLLRFQDAGARFARLPRFLAAFRVHTHQKTSAQIADLGERESARLRLRTFGREVDYREINRNIRNYLKRSMIFHWLHKLEIKLLMFIEHLRGENGSVLWYESESVYFYSLHKAGTALFTHVLRQVTGLTHVDYETMLFDNELPEDINYEKYGHLYGVFRIQKEKHTQPYIKLIRHISEKEFVKGKNIIFLVRDPRDVLISLYYSMGNSHIASSNEAISEELAFTRETIQSAKRKIDGFAKTNAGTIGKRFEILFELSKVCKHSVILRYEDLLNDYDDFIQEFDKYITIPDERKRELFEASRPREDEDLSAHKRSGKVGQYRQKLKPETILKINQVLKPVLKKFGYDE